MKTVLFLLIAGFVFLSASEEAKKIRPLYLKDKGRELRFISELVVLVKTWEREMALDLGPDNMSRIIFSGHIFGGQKTAEVTLVMKF